jgi:signal transduction histidine kinase
MEDDEGLARLLQKRLERHGFTVDVAHNGEQGLSMFAQGTYDIVAVDQSMPRLDGLEVIRILTSQGDVPPTIMITGSGDEQTAVEAMKLGASDYIVKDVEGGYLELLPSVIEQTLQKQRLLDEKHRADDEREKLIDELNAFAHTVAHDLKSPLNIISGSTRLLLEDYPEMPEGEVLELLATVTRTADKMNNIIDELLLLAGVRTLRQVVIISLDMAQIVADAQQRLFYMIKDYRAEIVVPEAWPEAMGHGAWVEQVWINYISNALKYGGTPPHVELGAEPQPDGMVRFTVRDNGRGISPEEQARLFQEFIRLGQTRAGGHGLGLSIVRRIVEKLGGEVGVESEIGRGSIFSFTLPGSAS